MSQAVLGFLVLLLVPEGPFLFLETEGDRGPRTSSRDSGFSPKAVFVYVALERLGRPSVEGPESGVASVVEGAGLGEGVAGVREPIEPIRGANLSLIGLVEDFFGVTGVSSLASETASCSWDG